jgi:flagellar biosynthesis protein FliR
VIPADPAALAFQAVLLLAWLGSAVMLLPGLGEPDVPPTIRLSLVLALVALLLPVLAPVLPPVPDALPDLLRVMLVEVGAGLWLGLLARLLALALMQAGQVAALMVGLASPLQTDPQLGAHSTALGRMFGLLAAALLLGSGLYALPLRAIAESYAVLPPGGALPLAAGAEAVAQAVADSLGLALRLAAPLVLAAMLGNLALGLLARVAPQVQIYAVAAPGQILGGLLLLALLLPALLAVWGAGMREGLLRLPGLG